MRQANLFPRSENIRLNQNTPDYIRIGKFSVSYLFLELLFQMCFV